MTQSDLTNLFTHREKQLGGRANQERTHDRPDPQYASQRQSDAGNGAVHCHPDGTEGLFQLVAELALAGEKAFFAFPDKAKKLNNKID